MTETKQERRTKKSERRSSHERRGWSPPPQLPFYDSEGVWVTDDPRRPSRDRRTLDRRHIHRDGAIQEVFNRFALFGALGVLIIFLWVFRNSEAFSMVASALGRLLNIIKSLLGG